MPLFKQDTRNPRRESWQFTEKSSALNNKIRVNLTFPISWNILKANEWREIQDRAIFYSKEYTPIKVTCE